MVFAQANARLLILTGFSATNRICGTDCGVRNGTQYDIIVIYLSDSRDALDFQRVPVASL